MKYTRSYNWNQNGTAEQTGERSEPKEQTRFKKPLRTPEETAPAIGGRSEERELSSFHPSGDPPPAKADVLPAAGGEAQVEMFTSYQKLNVFFMYVGYSDVRLN